MSDGPNPSGLCLCGCGERTSIADWTHGPNVAGRPLRYVAGHHRRKQRTLRGYRQRGGDYEHRTVWEDAHGPIPLGCRIHHIDGDVTNNELTNLQLLTQREHSRIHAGWELREGVWFKPCSRCKQLLPTSAFYPRRTGHKEFTDSCRSCNTDTQRERASRFRGGDKK